MLQLRKMTLPILLGAGFITGAPAEAALSITSDGAADGFTLSLFADQFPATGYCCGPLGIATNSLNQVVIQDYRDARNYVFKDVDGQHFSDALSSAPYQSSSYGASITNSNGTLYATNNDAGAIVYKLNNDGSINSPLTTTNAGGHGIWTNPATGHLVAATANSINDIDPSTGSFTQIVSGFNADGVSVSGDGKTIYGAGNGHVYGWNYSGALVYDSGALGSPDGTGVIQGNNLFSGDVVANDNSGNVWLLDPKKNTKTIIASGGSRGDYVGLDPSNGTLFLSQSDSVYRLSCGKDCGFTAPVPEPSTYLLMALGLGIVGLQKRRQA